MAQHWHYIKNRDGGVCIWGLHSGDGCGGGISVHHIHPRGTGGSDEEKNLISLCMKHHEDAEAYRIKANEFRDVLADYYGYEYTEQERMINAGKG